MLIDMFRIEGQICDFQIPENIFGITPQEKNALSILTKTDFQKRRGLVIQMYFSEVPILGIITSNIYLQIIPLVMNSITTLGQRFNE